MSMYSTNSKIENFKLNETFDKTLDKTINHTMNDTVYSIHEIPDLEDDEGD